MGKFCIKCGKALPDDALFCDGCGAKVQSIQEETPKQNIHGLAQNEQVNAIDLNQPSERTKKNSPGCGIVAGIVAVLIFVVCVVAISTNNKSTSAVDDAFIESMNTAFGTTCGYTLSDHRAWYNEDLEEYLGTGSFTTSDTGDLKYQYNYRAFINESNTIVFAKVDVYDPFGNIIIDYYNEEGEMNHFERNGI